MKTFEQQIEAAPTDTLEAIAWGEDAIGRVGRASAIRVIMHFVKMSKTQAANQRVAIDRNYMISRLRNNGFKVNEEED